MSGAADVVVSPSEEQILLGEKEAEIGLEATAPVVGEALVVVVDLEEELP